MSSKRQLKVVILGDSAVGKTSLMSRFVNDEFVAMYKPTIGADFLCKDIEVAAEDGARTRVRLQIWDTAGQEQWYQSLGATYYRGADACVLVYDVTLAKTLQSLETWRAEFLSHANPADPARFPFVVVGNMVDKQDQIVVSAQRGENFAQVRGGNIRHFQASAKTGENVREVFEQLAVMACARQAAEAPAAAPDAFVIRGDAPAAAAGRRGCC